MTNLDRAAIENFEYPIGVTEPMTIIFNDVVTLTDVYEINLSLENDDILFKKIEETDAELTKTSNTLVWVVHFTHDTIQERTYRIEIKNVTQNYIEIKGLFKVTSTIDG